MSPSDASKTLLNTDYPYDKIVATFSGSFTALARHGAFSPRRTEVEVPHNLGDYGLINGVYSTNGGTTWLQFGIVDADVSGSTPTFQTVEVTAYCTTSNIVLVGSNYLASNVTVQYALQVIAR